MAWYPRLEIDLRVIRRNVSAILARCRKWQTRPVFVTKGFLADFPLVQLLYEIGIRNFADSNLPNLVRMRTFFGQGVHLSLIRLPMIQELETIIEIGCIPFVSHWETLERMNAVAQKRRRVQDVILAIEIGDAREGFLPEELSHAGERLKNFPWISVAGTASTLACLNGVLPDEKILKQLIKYKEDLKKELGKEDFFLSVGGTTFFELWEKKANWEGVDELRFGEAFLFGSDISRKKNISWLEQGAFKILAEIVEIRSKEIDPHSQQGFDAFGKSVYPFLKGKRKRALLAVGKQDVDEHQLYFADSGVTIVGATSNYLVVDVEESTREYQVGDVLCFHAGYGAALRAFLSPYVEKVYVKGEGVGDEYKVQGEAFSGSC